MISLKNICFSCLLIGNVIQAASQTLPTADYYKSNRSLTYDEVIAAYKTLDAKHGKALMITGGTTDSGRPLHLFVISGDSDFDPVSIRKKGKAIFLINNAIHPGEPDGVDASLKLARELLENSRLEPLIKQVVVCIIPVYNIDGALNRGCCSRANQDGPESYGFRGNARNLDLNRDFVKADAKNTQSFISFFRTWDPDVFADTHVSDGADYQYTMTLIATQHNKLHPVMGSYLHDKMEPAIYDMMKKKGNEMCPYVNTRGETPESGIEGFYESPRFATGYTALFNTIGFVLETHMLKPFPQRVEATYQLLASLLEYTSSNAEEIKSLRKLSNDECSRKTEFPLHWQMDTTSYSMISFKGFEAKHKTSEVTGLERLYYDRAVPYEKPVKYFDTYRSISSVVRPDYYIIPQAWTEVIDRLKWNEIKMTPLTKDTLMEVECYYITGYESGKQPYEGHYLHKNTTVRKEKQRIQFYRGDLLIPVNQPCNRFIVETLEPVAPDSWFSWGFFDSVLQQKEWFSDYVFEEKAEEILRNDADLKRDFEKKKAEDKVFASDHWAMLLYVYQHSPYYEKSCNRYPVFRISK